MLDPADAAELRRLLLPFAARFREVRVFGSRATGRARRNSDLDLVIFEADEKLVAEMATALEESLLPMTVDLVAYERVTSDLLRNHIDRVSQRFELGEATP